MNPQKVVVFDLDETIGYFTELGAFIDALENWLNKSISRTLFNQILDLFARFYLRPNILSILRYLKEKKEAGICSKVMIYTNNNGPRRWVLSIKSYLEYKLNYKLFDRIISAYKIGDKKIEKCRTTHEKTYDDFLACSRVSKNAKICFLDDTLHPRMKHDQIDYIHLTQYRFTVPFKKLTDIFLNSKVGDMIDDPNEFNNYMYNSMFKNMFTDMRGGKSYLSSVERKQIIKRLHNFLYKF